MKLLYWTQIYSIAYGGLLSDFKNTCVSIFDYKTNSAEQNRKRLQKFNSRVVGKAKKITFCTKIFGKKTIRPKWFFGKPKYQNFVKN